MVEQGLLVRLKQIFDEMERNGLEPFSEANMRVLEAGAQAINRHVALMFRTLGLNSGKWSEVAVFLTGLSYRSSITKSFFDLVRQIVTLLASIP